MFGLGADMIFRIPALLIALTVHEYAHARAAVWQGDPTPRFMGRLTLNPVAHLDPIGLLMLWLFKFGWAKPVPVNPGNFHNPRRGMLLVSLAGPAANIITAFLGALIFAILTKGHLSNNWLDQILILSIMYNVVLAVFNLVPFPPLDGSKILTSLLPGRWAYDFERITPYSPIILMALIYFGVIGILISPFIDGLYLIINSLVKFIII